MTTNLKNTQEDTAPTFRKTKLDLAFQNEARVVSYYSKRRIWSVH